jgi:hypothetical protein
MVNTGFRAVKEMTAPARGTAAGLTGPAAA